MSKKLTKISLTILTLVCAFCMSIAMIGVAKADTTLYQATDFKMETAVQIRQDGTNGIRFWASMSAEDYNNLKDVEGIEFGIMIAPTDWLGSADDLRFGNDALPEWYDGTDATKYFAKGVNVPVLDTDNFDQDDDVTEYLLHASFINIKESNFSRSFTAKAYYRVGDEVVYAQGANEKNIFETASKYVAMSDFDETEPKEKFVKDYVYGIVDKVAEVYTDVQVSLDVDAIVDGVAYRDDQVNATATLKKPGDDTKELKAQLKVALTKDGEEIENGVVYDAETQKFELATSGIFKLATKLGSKIDEANAIDLTLKRREVKVEIIPCDGVALRDFKPQADVTKILMSDFAFAGNNAPGNAVVLRAKITDPENSKIVHAEVPEGRDEVDVIDDRAHFTGGYTFTNNPTWLKMTYNEGYAYVSLVERKKANNSSVKAVYVDNYGVGYDVELPILPYADFAFYGKNEQFSATDALMVTFTKNQWVTFEDVPLTGSITDNIIDFTVVNPLAKDSEGNIIYDETTGYATFETTLKARTYTIRVSNPSDPSIYIDYYFGMYSSTHVCTGLRAYNWDTSTWGSASGYSKIGITASGTVESPTLKYITGYPANGGMGTYYDEAAIIKCLIGKNSYNHNPDKYKNETFGFSIVDSQFYINYGKSNSWISATASIFPRNLQQATGYLFDAFDNLDKVDISIAECHHYNNPGATFVITRIGGETIDASWENKVHYTQGTAPAYHTPVVEE